MTGRGGECTTVLVFPGNMTTPHAFPRKKNAQPMFPSELNALTAFPREVNARERADPTSCQRLHSKLTWNPDIVQVQYIENLASVKVRQFLMELFSFFKRILRGLTTGKPYFKGRLRDISA